MWQRIVSIILVIAAAAIPVAAQEWRTQVVRSLDAKADAYGQLSRTIWEAAEVGYKETKSAAVLPRAFASTKAWRAFRRRLWRRGAAARR
jgi:metal-dependent amidase/aminoacylase/carboxypeptidase family protein